jgi:DNA-binding response OmpR family regulator
LVEDDRSTASALQKILVRRGWHVEVAASVAEALARLDADFDWAILDLMLPDGDGESVLRAIRARGLPTRVAVSTGISDHRRLKEVRALTPEVFLGKPIDLAALFAGLGQGGNRL